MSVPLRQALNDLTSSFASKVLDAIRGAPLEELLGGTPVRVPRFAQAAPLDKTALGSGRRGTGRLPRRSSDDIANVVENIVNLLRRSPKGLRAEQIRQKQRLQAKELPRPLKEALDSGRLAKSGRKGATTYFVKGSGTAGTSAAGPVAARGGCRATGGRAKSGRLGRVAARKKSSARATSAGAATAVQNS